MMQIPIFGDERKLLTTNGGHSVDRILHPYLWRSTWVWGTMVTRGVRPMASWLYNNGGALVHLNEQGIATETALTDENIVEDLQFLQDRMYVHEVAPPPDVESQTGQPNLVIWTAMAISICISSTEWQPRRCLAICPTMSWWKRI